MQDRRPRFSIANTNEAAPKRENYQRTEETGPASQRLMNMLSELNQRLGQDEAEREKLWREIDTTRQAIMNLEDKSEQIEKIFITLENKISRSTNMKNLEKWRRLIEENQRALYAQIKKVDAASQKLDDSQKKLGSRVDTVETTAGSALVKIDEVSGNQEKLSRRIEHVSDERVKLLKKMEGLEDTIRQTQETLRAKALVMLTDQGLGTSAKTDAVTIEPPVVQKPAADDPWAMDMDMMEEFDDRHPMKIQKERDGIRRMAVAASVVVLVGVLAAGAWYAKDRVNFEFQVPSFEMASLTGGAETSPESTTNTLRAEDENVLSTLNAPTAETTVTAAPTEAPDMEATTVSGASMRDFAADEERAVEAFMARAPQTPVAQRIQPDPNLPPLVKEIEAKAFAGSGAAQHDLAAIYTAGHAGVKGSYEKAAQWFHEASYGEIPNARYNLAVLTQQGLGVPKDEERAVELYKAASAIGHPEAQYNLGIAYIEGVGVEHNVAHAAYYFERAAVNGVNEAAYNLGLIYENGLTGAAQPDEALYWYKMAADEGNPEAIQALANLSGQMGLTPRDVDALVSRLAVLRPAMKPQTMETPAETTAPAPTREEESRVTEPQQTTPASAEPAVTVEETDTSAASGFSPGSQAVIIAQIQEQLMRMGMYPGPADGIPGPLTEDAVAAYQSQHNLQPTGQATEDLLVHMLAEEFELNSASEFGSAR